MTQQPESITSSLLDAGKRLAALYIDNAKLTLAEKATQIIAALALCLIGMLLGIVALVFLIIGLATLLENFIEPFWTYFIVGGAFLLIIGLIVIFRVPLVYNPISRFLSRLFLDSPNS